MSSLNHTVIYGNKANNRKGLRLCLQRGASCLKHNSVPVKMKNGLILGYVCAYFYERREVQHMAKFLHYKNAVPTYYKVIVNRTFVCCLILLKERTLVRNAIYSGLSQCKLKEN